MARPGYEPESSCIGEGAPGHVHDTAGVGYCVRCGRPNGAKQPRYFPPEPEPLEWEMAVTPNGPGRTPTRRIPTPTVEDDDPEATLYG